jgi:hypothetical protein
MNPLEAIVEAILFLLRQAELSSDPSVHADAKRLAAQVLQEVYQTRVEALRQTASEPGNK